MKLAKIEPWLSYVYGATASLRCACGITNMHDSPAYLGSYSKKAVESLRSLLPYCLHPVTDDVLIWLNREYKPLGVLPYGRWVDYQAFSWVHVRKDDLRLASLLPLCELVHRDTYYLFLDGNPPWNCKRDALRLLRMLEPLTNDIDALESL